MGKLTKAGAMLLADPITVEQPQLWIRGEGIPNGSRI
jgi:hypothetical protein